MTKVFIAGSRHLWQLNETVRNRILNVIDKKYQVFVGDANGIDKAVQNFLKNIHYENVRVFCSGKRCRNNIGNWETVNIPVQENIKGLKFYMAKDIEMAKEANFGFMIWDGKSAGTLNNVIQLIKRNKKVLIYFTPAILSLICCACSIFPCFSNLSASSSHSCSSDFCVWILIPVFISFNLRSSKIR